MGDVLFTFDQIENLVTCQGLPQVNVYIMYFNFVSCLQEHTGSEEINSNMWLAKKLLILKSLV
jgi:hypothetical protein